MNAATVQTPAGQREGAVTLDSWESLLFLVRDPDRHGRPVFNVRLVIGTLPPWRYGPFQTEENAREGFAALRSAVQSELLELFCEMGDVAGVCGNEEF